MQDVLYSHIDIYHYSTIYLNCIFLKSNLHLHFHDKYFVKIFYSSFPVITLIIFLFKCSVLFGTHTFLDNSLRVLQLPTHLSNLTANR